MAMLQNVLDPNDHVLHSNGIEIRRTPMTKNALMVATVLCAAALVPGWCNAQDLTAFEPSAVTQDSAIVLNTADSSSDVVSSNEGHLVRNCLVVIGLGVTFCVGMAITATTIQQNRPTTPRPTQFYAS